MQVAVNILDIRANIWNFSYYFSLPLIFQTVLFDYYKTHLFGNLIHYFIINLHQYTPILMRGLEPLLILD